MDCRWIKSRRFATIHRRATGRASPLGSETHSPQVPWRTTPSCFTRGLLEASAPLMTMRSPSRHSTVPGVVADEVRVLVGVLLALAAGVVGEGEARRGRRSTLWARPTHEGVERAIDSDAIGLGGRAARWRFS